jgi:hypothetical protein
MAIIFDITQRVAGATGTDRGAAGEAVGIYEDSGQAMIVEFGPNLPEDAHAGMFVRVQSWDERAKNRAMNIAGKTVRVIVEVLD